MPVDIDRARRLARALMEVLEQEDGVSQAEITLQKDITLTGTIGRPEVMVIKGTPLFTAGLGIRRIDAKLEWIAIEAWREVATQLSAKQRGKVVTVTGRWKNTQWVDRDGVRRSRDVFVVETLEREA